LAGDDHTTAGAKGQERYRSNNARSPRGGRRTPARRRHSVIPGLRHRLDSRDREPKRTAEPRDLVPWARQKQSGVSAGFLV